jgi:hypothetical protein
MVVHHHLFKLEINDKAAYVDVKKMKDGNVFL